MHSKRGSTKASLGRSCLLAILAASTLACSASLPSLAGTVNDPAPAPFDDARVREIGTKADELAGPLPRDVIASEGPVDYSRIPEYIEVLDRDGEFAGYVESVHVFDPTSDESFAPPVFAEDLRTVVGHFHFGGVGFVALGLDASKIAPIEGSELRSPEGPGR